VFAEGGVVVGAGFGIISIGVGALLGVLVTVFGAAMMTGGYRGIKCFFTLGLGVLTQTSIIR